MSMICEHCGSTSVMIDEGEVLSKDHPSILTDTYCLDCGQKIDPELVYDYFKGIEAEHP